MKILIVIFLSVFVLSFGFGWNWFLKYNECIILDNKTTNLLDRQSDLIFNFGLFAEKILKEDNKEKLKKYIELQEPMIQAKIEHFSKTCRSSYLNQTSLFSLLQSYDYYLSMKQGLFNENQQAGFLWTSKLIPEKFLPIYKDYK